MSDKILSWIKPYSELVLDRDKVFCRACGKIVSIPKRKQCFYYSKKEYLKESINFNYFLFL